MAKTYGARQKDISVFEGVVTAVKNDSRMYLREREEQWPKLEAALYGDFSVYSEFDIYEWVDAGFILRRGARA